MANIPCRVYPMPAPERWAHLSYKQQLFYELIGHCLFLWAAPGVVVSYV